jgi:polygalacturonase
MKGDVMKAYGRLWTWLAAISWASGLAMGIPGPGTRVFDVREYGARGDGHAVDTAAIQKALDECGKAGGGVVRLTAGTYLCQPISLASKTTLQLDEGATLQASSQNADFMKTPGDWTTAKSGDFVPLISGKALTDVAITGKGAIDGAGQAWWGPAEEARRKTSGFTLPRPRMIILTGCKNVRITGVTLANSPSFHLVPTDCQDVVIDGVTIRAPDSSPNTDGIDPSLCCRVRITRCTLDVGDDNIAIKSGRKVEGREFACEDITVSDCTFLHGHGMSIGSETVGGVRDLTVERCTFNGTESGIRIKSDRSRGGCVQDLIYRDITMKDVKTPINITTYYPKVPKEDTARPVTPRTPAYRNIRISNVTATSPQSAGWIVGLPESIISGVILENVRISAPEGLQIRNAKSVQVRGTQVEVRKGQPFILEANTSLEGWQGPQ